MAKVMPNPPGVKAIPPVRGGKTKMFGKQHSGTQEPDCTTSCATSPAGGFPMGGKGKMFGFTGSKPAKAC